MNETIFNIICDCQAHLIEALDQQDVGAIENHTQQLSQLLSQAETIPVQALDTAKGEVLDFAIRQCHAAGIRVNYLANWTRQRIDRLDELRGLPLTNGYRNI